jgi:hypothetical protein
MGADWGNPGVFDHGVKPRPQKTRQTVRNGWREVWLTRAEDLIDHVCPGPGRGTGLLERRKSPARGPGTRHKFLLVVLSPADPANRVFTPLM